MKSIGITDPSDFGRDPRPGMGDSKSYDQIQSDYRDGLQNLNQKYLDKEISMDQLLQGQSDLEDMKNNAMSTRRKN